MENLRSLSIFWLTYQSLHIIVLFWKVPETLLWFVSFAIGANRNTKDVFVVFSFTTADVSWVLRTCKCAGPVVSSLSSILTPGGSSVRLDHITALWTLRRESLCLSACVSVTAETRQMPCGPIIPDRMTQKHTKHNRYIPATALVSLDSMDK